MDIQNEITELKEMLGSLLKIVSADTATSNEEYGSYIMRWYESYKLPINGANTSKDMLNYIQNKIIPSLGNIPLNRLSGDNIQSLLVGIRKSNTREKVAQVIKGSLVKAVKLRLIKYNPYDAVEIRSHKNKHYRPLNLEEQAIMYEYLKNKLYFAVFNIMICTGMRIGEFLGLDVNCIDTKNRIIKVYKTVDIKTGEIQDRTKSYTSMRGIPYLEELTPYLKEVTGYMKKRGRLTYNQVKQYFKKAYKKKELRGLNLHSFRHTFGCMCYKSGISDKQIQRLMGHASIEVTMNIYVDIIGSGNSPLSGYFKRYKNDVEGRPTEYWRISSA